MSKLVLLASLLALVACGSEPEPALDFEVALPMLAGLDSCGMPAALRGQFRAELEVGGHESEPCALDVDTTALTDSGRCKGIAIGRLRPLGISYRIVELATSDRYELAYIISWVDLRRSTLASGTEQVEVEVVLDGIQALQVDTDAEVTALPGEVPANAPAARANLLYAEVWAKNERLLRRPFGFDNDRDGTSNLVEACQGTLTSD